MKKLSLDTTILQHQPWPSPWPRHPWSRPLRPGRPPGLSLLLSACLVPPQGVCGMHVCICCVHKCVTCMCVYVVCTSVWHACVYMLCVQVCGMHVCICLVHCVCICVCMRAMHVYICCVYKCVVCMCVYAICTRVFTWCECVCMLCARVHGPGRAISSRPHSRLCDSSGASPARTQVEGGTSDLPPRGSSQLFGQCPGPPVAPEKGSPASSGLHGCPAPLPHAESRRAPESGRTIPAAGPQRGGQSALGWTVSLGAARPEPPRAEG